MITCVLLILNKYDTWCSFLLALNGNSVIKKKCAWMFLPGLKVRRAGGRLSLIPDIRSSTEARYRVNYVSGPFTVTSFYRGNLQQRKKSWFLRVRIYTKNCLKYLLTQISVLVWNSYYIFTSEWGDNLSLDI